MEQRKPPSKTYQDWEDKQTCERCGYSVNDCTCPGACVDWDSAPPYYDDEEEKPKG